MVKIMNLRNSSKGCDGFWEAYRACAEENKVRPDLSHVLNRPGLSVNPAPHVKTRAFL